MGGLRISKHRVGTGIIKTRYSKMTSIVKEGGHKAGRGTCIVKCFTIIITFIVKVSFFYYMSNCFTR